MRMAPLAALPLLNGDSPFLKRQETRRRWERGERQERESSGEKDLKEKGVRKQEEG